METTDATDTPPDADREGPRVRVEAGADGGGRAAARGDVCIVVDVLRASTTICTALAAGAHAVVPVADVPEERKELPAGADALLVAERDGRKLPQADRDNSPAGLLEEDLGGRTVILSTTNGTRVLQACAAGGEAEGRSEGPPILVGALVNASAVARSAVREAADRGSDVAIVLAGRRGTVEDDDVLGGAVIWGQMTDVTPRATGSPAAAVVRRLLSATPVARRLVDRGRGEDVDLAADIDRFNITPRYQDGRVLHEGPAKRPGDR